MIHILHKIDCCGCAACVQRCPKQCISLYEDEEGFLYPRVDKDICIDCGLCEKVCPVLNQAEQRKPLNVYAAKNRDFQKRELSSSGGLFIALAEQVIAKGGVVFGCVFAENWEAHHVAATTMEELQPMMRSKYIQSRTENTFAKAELYLKQGREVMYVGTSCQIAALKLFLRKEYDNLLAVDLICHGVPSPGVWRRYLQEEIFQSALCAATGKNSVLNHSLKFTPVMTGISFREKSRSGYDWEKFGFVVWGKSGNKARQNTVLSSDIYSDNPFMKGFLSNVYLRPSCYACPAKGGTSRADITIADYWGIKYILPDFYDASGIGLAVVHSKKGRKTFDAAGFDRIETTLADATKGNSSYWKPVEMPKCRKKFYILMGNGTSIRQSVNECLRLPLILQILRKIKSKLRTLFYR